MNTSPRYANTSPRFANTSPRFPFNGDSSDQISSPTAEVEAQQRLALVEWLNSIVPHFYLSVKATEDELRSSLLDGIVLCEILNKLKPGTVDERGDSSPSSDSRRYRISRFIASVNEMGLPSFLMSDLEKGPMKPVLDCLLAFKDRSMPNFGGVISKAGEDRRKELSDTKFQRALHTSVPSESPAAVLLGGNKFHEVFQLKQGLYADLPAMKLSEMMKSNSLDNAPTQSLLSVINGILDESIERKNAEIPQRVACLLRKVVQEIERRIATQAEHLRTQSNLFKAREEKYQSRIRVLEALAKGTSEESEIAMNQLQHMKFEKSKMEEKKKREEEEVTKLKRQKDESSLEVSTLKQELEMAKKANEEFAKFKKQTDESGTELSTLKQELEMAKKANEEFVKLKKQTDESGVELSTLKQELEMAKKATQEVENLKKQKDESSLEVLTLKQELEMAKKAHEEIAKLKRQKDESGFEVSMLKQELEMAKKTHEQHFLELEKQAKLVRSDLEQRLKEQNQLLEYSKKRIKEVEENSESKCHSLSKKAHVYESFIDTQFTALQELRHSSEVLKRDILKSQKSYLEEMNKLGQKLKKMAEAAQKYHEVLSENRKIYNELQDLKGNIRVYCRIRPFLPGESETQTVVEHIGEHGELVITNSSNRGMDGQKPFKFNMVYGPTATQAKVFADTQPLIRTVLDGYNVCIFAYGQTGSGKTHTMSGPDNATKEEWGVNYRALDDLFHISEDRKSYFLYEIAIQMIEIYNEQVRDLLSTDGSAKKLGILATTQPHGLAVPDASMLPVQSTSDVIELMNIGLTNRAVGSTAMNVRSSRSHSIVTIHVRGKDLKTGSTSQGNLHLVDLAGSERVDRSEAVGDRLREAQHINKSLSALGDVIFALAQKSSHVPYRNSKLTQVLQTSLGGRAKTLMFVQINPDVTSNSETLSTLKFAERVSGVELGAARSNKEGRDVKELMEQVASLKDTIAKKDEEIERLQVLKDHPKNVSILKRNSSWQRNGTSPTSAGTLGSPRSPTPRSPSSSSKRSPLSQKTTLDHENSTEYSHTDDIEHKNGSLRSSRSMNDLMQQRQYKLAEEERSVSVDDDFLGLDDADNEEKSSEISDGDLSIRTDPDGVLEEKLSPKSSKRSENTEKRIEKSRTGSKLLASPRTSTPTTPSRLSQVRTAVRTTSALKKPSSGSSSPVTPARRRL